MLRNRGRQKRWRGSWRTVPSRHLVALHPPHTTVQRARRCPSRSRREVARRLQRGSFARGHDAREFLVRHRQRLPRPLTVGRDHLKGPASGPGFRGSHHYVHALIIARGTDMLRVGSAIRNEFDLEAVLATCTFHDGDPDDSAASSSSATFRTVRIFRAVMVMPGSCLPRAAGSFGAWIPLLLPYRCDLDPLTTMRSSSWIGSNCQVQLRNGPIAKVHLIQLVSGGDVAQRICRQHRRQFF